MASTSEDSLLLSRLAKWAKSKSDKQAVAFLASSGTVDQAYTYKELDTVTTKLARRLIHEGISEGDRVVLVYPPCLDFGLAFLACLKAKVVAVPVFPPNPTRRDTLAMFCKIVESCSAQYALTNGTYQHAKKLSSLRDTLKKRKGSPQWPDSLNWIVTTTDKRIPEKVVLPPSPSSDVLAFLQFTSGSTSVPKGVMISHGNLQHNLQIITSELKAVDDTVVVSWLPQYHDMGLIGSLLGCIYCGGSGYYLSPLSFLQRPMLWIESVSKYQATHLQAPNFAFKLTARKYNDSQKISGNLDLSSVRHVINAAEPVDVESMSTFYKVFGKHGFKDGVIFPTYGLAEHTVFVCSGGQQVLDVNKHELETNGQVVTIQNATQDDDNCSTLVGCGYPHRQNVTVRIVSTAEQTVLPDGRVGEIWVQSPSKAQGYFKKPLETSEDFQARLQGDDEEYLRTGDLGFMHQQELFICGRLKDLIIVGGRNYYPQDIEATAEATAQDRVRLGCSAAFTVDPKVAGDEKVALVMELKEQPTKGQAVGTCEPLVNQIKAAINQEHSLGLSEIILLEARTVPKTSSGKIARSWCRQGYLAQTLKVVYRKSYGDASQPTALEVDGESTVPVADNTAPSTQANSSSEIRSMSKTALVAKLMQDISRFASTPEETLDTRTALVSMLDSITISQFKGFFESRYASKISDEYLFRDSTTIMKLAEVARLGYAPDDGGDSANENVASGTGGVGQATGLAGALGCPPGVVCNIL